MSTSPMSTIPNRGTTARDGRPHGRPPRRRPDLRLLVLASVAGVVLTACGGGGSPASPSQPSPAAHPIASESAHFRFFKGEGDVIEADRQEAFHAWAVARLGVTVPAKIDYHKYVSREDMGAHTGRYNTNGYAEPERFAIHTLWPWDNHETVHVYSALIGRPSDFFNEGIAVAFQTDPLNGRFEPAFNGLDVHEAARQYRGIGQLVLPLSCIVATSDFRAVSDSVLAYREAGSFVAFLIERFGIDGIRRLFQASTRDDSLPTIRERFQGALGVSLEQAEAEWLAFLG